MLGGIGGRAHTGVVSDVHQTSQADPRAGHHTVSHGFDPELVADDRGATRRPEPGCPVEIALAAVSGRWTTLVLRELLGGARSFGELRAALPAPPANVLTDRLGELVRGRLAVREVTPGCPARTSYRLTDAGERLGPLLVELYRTGSALAALTT